MSAHTPVHAGDLHALVHGDGGRVHRLLELDVAAATVHCNSQRRRSVRHEGRRKGLFRGRGGRERARREGEGGVGRGGEGDGRCNARRCEDELLAKEEEDEGAQEKVDEELHGEGLERLRGVGGAGLGELVDHGHGGGERVEHAGEGQ